MNELFIRRLAMIALMNTGESDEAPVKNWRDAGKPKNDAVIDALAEDVTPPELNRKGRRAAAAKRRKR